MNLDDPARLAAVDPAGALADVEGTPEQWRRALRLRLPPVDPADVDAVVITGMGGSGICGDVAAAIAADQLPIPVLVHKGFGMPGFVGPRTAVLVASSSGDTRETLDAARSAIERGAQVAAVTGGGRLAALCDEHDLPWVTVPREAQPRHSLGFLAVPILDALGLTSGMREALDVQEAVVRECGRGIPSAANPAKRLAGALVDQDGVPVQPFVYGAQGLAAVAAYRLKCQLHENAELGVAFGVLPEAGHNEIVSWRPPGVAAPLVCFRDRLAEPPLLQSWMQALLGRAAQRFSAVHEVDARGSGALARLASMLLFGDLVSVYVALALGRDPTPITEIDNLKAALADAERREVRRG